MLGILVLGHGGGVPYGRNGNTNFAIIPDLDPIWSTVNGVYKDSMLSTAWPNLLKNHKYWLVDCGPETVLRLSGCLYSDAVVNNLEGIFITHTHADHSGGLASLAWRTRFIEKTKPYLVYPVGIKDLLLGQLTELNYMSSGLGRGIESCFKVIELDPMKNNNKHKVSAILREEFTVSATSVNHNLYDKYGGIFPAYCLTIEINGKKILFSGDIAEYIGPYLTKEADVIFHDCQTYDDGTKNTHVHCPWPTIKQQTTLFDKQLQKELRSKIYIAHCEKPSDCDFEGFKHAEQGTLVVI